MFEGASRGDSGESSRLASLWRHPDFVKLWAGNTLMAFANQITSLALPLTAVLVLSASPAQMGILKAAHQAPWLLITLVAGVWVDRLPRRPVMIVARFIRAAVLASIPIAALLGVLHVEQLYIVAFLASAFFMLSRTAHNSYVLD